MHSWGSGEMGQLGFPLLEEMGLVTCPAVMPGRRRQRRQRLLGAAGPPKGPGWLPIRANCWSHQGLVHVMELSAWQIVQAFKRIKICSGPSTEIWVWQRVSHESQSKPVPARNPCGAWPSVFPCFGSDCFFDHFQLFIISIDSDGSSFPSTLIVLYHFHRF